MSLKKRTTRLVYFLFLVVVGPTSAFGQFSNEVLKQRTKLMHETIISSDEAHCENFIKGNYTKRLLEKYDMEWHLDMFKRLHRDFSDSQITSMKFFEDKVLMEIQRITDNHKVTFEITYDQEDNYKFNGFSIEAGELR